MPAFALPIAPVQRASIRSSSTARLAQQRSTCFSLSVQTRRAAGASQTSSVQFECSASTSKPILYTTPTSNFGARPRHVVYALGLETEILVERPPGFKKPEWSAINPLGKIPAFRMADGTVLPESELIVQFLVDKYKGQQLVPATPELRARAAYIARLHDIYMHPHQKALYNRMPAEKREESFAAIETYLDQIEACVGGTRFLAGDRLTTADLALYPTFVYYHFILFRYWGWTEERLLGARPKLRAWWAAVNEDPVVQRVRGEMEKGLTNWADAGRLLDLEKALKETGKFE
eukprot:tig00020961_g16711.t1